MHTIQTSLHNVANFIDVHKLQLAPSCDESWKMASKLGYERASSENKVELEF